MLSKNKFAEDGGRLPFAGQLNQANAALFYVLCVVAAIEQRFGRSIRKHLRRPTEAPEVSA